jgi:hypothetical protein
MLNHPLNSLRSSEQDETSSSLGCNEQHSRYLGLWSNKTLIPKSININPSMHIHFHIGLVPFGQNIIIFSWKCEFYHGLFQTIIEA